MANGLGASDREPNRSANIVGAGADEEVQAENGPGGTK